MGYYGNKATISINVNVSKPERRQQHTRCVAKKLPSHVYRGYRIPLCAADMPDMCFCLTSRTFVAPRNVLLATCAFQATYANVNNLLAISEQDFDTS